MRYAIGKRAHTVCDICGITFRYKRRKVMWTGSVVCPECWNPKEASLTPNKYISKHADAEALRDGRPSQFDSIAEGPLYVDILRMRNLPPCIGPTSPPTLQARHIVYRADTTAITADNTSITADYE